MRKKTVKWTEEEKQELFALLREHHLNEAARIHAANRNRTFRGVIGYFKYLRQEGEIPQEVLDNIPTFYTPWSKKEVKDLLKLIETYPYNFKEAYRIHAENTGRTVESVSSFFADYRNKKDAKVCMVTVGKRRKASANRKNIHTGTGGYTTPIKASKWKRILEILFE